VVRPGITTVNLVGAYGQDLPKVCTTTKIESVFDWTLLIIGAKNPRDCGLELGGAGFAVKMVHRGADITGT